MPKAVGRPKSDIETEVIAVRIPMALGERLDTYLAHLEMQTGIKSNRNSIVRHALRLFLDSQEQQERSVQERQQLALPAVQASVQPVKKPQVLSLIRKQILEMIPQYPQGISPTEMRRVLQSEKDLRNTMKGMEKDGLLKRLTAGCYIAGEN